VNTNPFRLGPQPKRANIASRHRPSVDPYVDVDLSIGFTVSEILERLMLFAIRDSNVLFLLSLAIRVSLLTTSNNTLERLHLDSCSLFRHLFSLFHLALSRCLHPQQDFAGLIFSCQSSLEYISTTYIPQCHLPLKPLRRLITHTCTRNLITQI
jgi:hypothetical protein